MATYVLLSRYGAEANRALRNDPTLLRRLEDTLALWEAKVIANFSLLGEWDHVTVFEAPDNIKAYRAALEEALSLGGQGELMPAIDLPVFERLITQTTATAGPHRWQTQWWARVLRRAGRWYQYSRWSDRYCRPLTVSGLEHARAVGRPCIVIANHSSHMDTMVLHAALPERIKGKMLYGAAADRWFLKDRKEITLQPWYTSLITGCFPIQRGGGSRTLDYAKELLDKGWNVMLFPEGTRATGRNLGRFRHGVTLLALEKQVPVLPAYMSGLREMRPKGSKTITPGPAHVAFLPTQQFEPGTPVPEATQRLWDAMNGEHLKTAEKRRAQRAGAAAAAAAEATGDPPPG